MNKEFILISRKYFIRLSIATMVILLVPLVAMQFSVEVSWHLGDFVVAGLLLFGTGYLYKILTKNFESAGIKIIIGIIVLSLLILIWSVLAVDLV